MDSSTETLTENGSESVETAPLFTEEQLVEQEASLRAAIERGMEWFEFAQDVDAYDAMTEKEQIFSRLLDPLLWAMRDSLISFEHGDCEDCKVARETGKNNYAVAIAEMILGNL